MAMTQGQEDQRRDLDHTMRDTVPKLAKAAEKLQAVICSLAHLATILPGKEPLKRELRLAETALGRVGGAATDREG